MEAPMRAAFAFIVVASAAAFVWMSEAQARTRAAAPAVAAQPIELRTTAKSLPGGLLEVTVAIPVSLTNAQDWNRLYLVADRNYDSSTWVFFSLPRAGLDLGGAGGSGGDGNDRDETWTWRGRDGDLPGKDLGMGYRIQALLADDRHGEWQPGIVVGEDLRASAVALSNAVTFAPGNPPPVLPIPSECSIRISWIQGLDGKLVQVDDDQSEPIEVNLSAGVIGEVDKPDGYCERLVVQSDHDDQKWVMPRKGSNWGRFWTDTAYFGRPGLDMGGRFRLQAFVFRDTRDTRDTREPKVCVQFDEVYKPGEWALLEQNVCARSAEALVRRRESAWDLIIKTIGGKKPEVGQVCDVVNPVEIEGIIQSAAEEYRLKKGERIWVLIRDMAGRWQVAAPAWSSRDKVSWKAQPEISFPEDGTYWVKAIATTGKDVRLNDPLDAAAWEKLVAHGDLTRTSPQIEVRVSGVRPAPANSADRPAQPGDQPQ